jgi:uncharacterized membrane protein YgcG
VDVPHRSDHRPHHPSPGIPAGDIHVEGYTGRFGSKDRNLEASVEAGAGIFRATVPLDSYEGLTIVVTWPKGYVQPPTQEQLAREFLSDNRPALVGFIGLGCIVAYYILAWARVGRDPEAGTIMPLYEPPARFSPAALRYLTRMGYDQKAFAASVINLAVKKAIRIEEDSGEFTLHKQTSSPAGLSKEEQKIFHELLSGTTSLKLSNKHHSTIRGAINSLKSALAQSLETVYFVRNRRHFIIGLIGSAVAIALTILSAEGSGRKAGAIFMSVWLTGWTFGVVMLLTAVVNAWRAVGSGWRILQAIPALFITAFSIPFVGGELFGIFMMSQMLTPLTMVVIVTIAGVNASFYHWLKAPTMKGRELLDRVEGFKLFLTSVESDRMNVLYPGNKTPELFEKYLPYAMALDVEHEWSEKFADVLQQAAEQAREENYRPAWYVGSGFDSGNFSGFASSIGSSLSSAVSSSSTAPGSSSGSGGGGSSGGGGGGGGGGGW